MNYSDKSGLNEDADICSGRLSIEGRVVKRADCRPPQTADYMRMKMYIFFFANHKFLNLLSNISTKSFVYKNMLSGNIVFSHTKGFLKEELFTVEQ